MHEWIQHNFVYISAATNVGSLIVWAIYLQVFYHAFRLEQQPHLLIKQDGTFDLDSLCLLSNMSERNVDVAAVLIDVSCSDATCTFSLAALHTGARAQQRVHGPLGPGSYLELPSFRELVEEGRRRYTGDGDLVAPGSEIGITVRVVAFMGAQQLPRGARRRFLADFGDEASLLRPADLLPQQLAGRLQRRLARRWLEEAESLQRDPRGRTVPVDPGS